MTCPADSAHEVTISNMEGKPGLGLTCQGPAGHDAPGHAATVHHKMRTTGAAYFGEGPGAADLWEVPFPCRMCGCPESVVLAALGARPRDKYRQARSEAARCRCGQEGYSVGKLPALCLYHLAGRMGLVEVLFK